MTAQAAVAPAVAVVIVNFNAGEAILEALRSLARDAGIAWEVVVVDNASTDGSVADLESMFPGIRVIRNPENVGFGRGVNQGIAATQAPLVLMMNPDCVIEPGATALMADVLLDERCALVGPRILDSTGEVQGSARGDPDMLTGFFGRTSVLQRVLAGTAIAKRNVVSVDGVRANESSIVVDWVSGACMLARRAALHAVGGFDERYFLYWEDADLCRRLRGAGFTVRYVSRAVAVHQVGRSSRTAKAASIRAFHHSAYLYYSTHVARGAWSPRRLLARAALSARCWWRVRSLS